MKDTASVDKNFRVEKHPSFGDVEFRDCRNAPFTVHGLLYEGGHFRRIPEAVAKATNDGVDYLHTNTAGGRVRFVTNSSIIAIRAKMDGIGKMPHFALTGSAGFDLYKKEDSLITYAGTFVPPFDITDGYESCLWLDGEKQREIIINFPLYSNVISLEIGIRPGSTLSAAPAYTYSAPAVFYGSSITQGGCASRPGTAYQSILSRRFDMDILNLGFSGSAKGEEAIRSCIASLDMGIFFLDYDHNAPTAEHLEKTHAPFFRAVREAHPCLPVVIMSRPKVRLDDDEKKREEICRKTFADAKAGGDGNVWFLGGEELLREVPDEGLVDNSHPGDAGFVSMANTITELILNEKILAKQSPLR